MPRKLHRMSTATARRAQRPADRFDERRDQLAESALLTLGELGYARASLREIAANSPFSHGVVHYYFNDKIELIVYCVRYYKARCVHRYDAVVSDSTSGPGLLDAFAAKLRETLRGRGADAPALVRPAHPEHVRGRRCARRSTMIDHTLEEMIWRVVSRYGELMDRPVLATPAAAYGMLDGVFQQALLAVGTGSETALDTLDEQVHGADAAAARTEGLTG